MTDRRLAVLPLVLGLLAAHPAPAQPAPEDVAPEGASAIVAREPVFARRQMVVAAHPLAAEAGRAMLRQGGGAIDAAVAAEMVLNLVEPQSSGIGGGGFLLYHSAGDGAVTSFDGRETAPAAARPDRFLGPDGGPLPLSAAIPGGRSVGVPGTLRLLEAAHRKFGRLPWATLFAPALRLARDGYPLSERLHSLLAADPALRRFPAARDFYYQPDGSPKPAGTVLTNPALANVLAAVAAGGADAFYTGGLARDMVAVVASAPAAPGDLSEADLAGYRAVERPAVCGPYRRWRVCGMGPPSAGGIAVLQTLAVLERRGLDSLAARSAEAVHLIDEAERLAFADRDQWIADPAFAAVPVAGLLDAGYLDGRAGLVRADSSLGRAPAGDPPGRPDPPPAPDHGPGRPGTSQLTIIDGDGDAVSMTDSIESAFGSRLMVDGFLLNNQLTDFSFRPQIDGRPVANRVEPGKRPRSAMSPTMVLENDRPVLVLGSPGGPAIIPYVIKSLVAVLDWGMTPQAAAELGNFGSRNGPAELEAGTPIAALAPRLRALGETVRLRPQTSGVHMIAVLPDGRLAAGIDPRREGAALGD